MKLQLPAVGEFWTGNGLTDIIINISKDTACCKYKESTTDYNVSLQTIYYWMIDFDYRKVK